MKKVTLKFPSARLLWEYKQAINSLTIEANMRELTLICECSDDEIELALKRFHAIIVSQDNRV